MRRALSEYVVGGIRTNLPFHERLFEHPEFVAGSYDTGFIDRHRDVLLTGSRIAESDKALFAAAIAIAAHRSEHVKKVGSNGMANGNGNGTGKLSPWVVSHRARLGRMRRE
jgi:acetyl-CoA carboxylase biotin carboxylase subunit